MTRVVSPDREGAELAGQAIEGLELLAEAMFREGDPFLPGRCRTYVKQLQRVPTASTALAIEIAGCLEILAQRWADIDRPDVADIWRERAKRIQERAWDRARQGTQP